MPPDDPRQVHEELKSDHEEITDTLRSEQSAESFDLSPFEEKQVTAAIKWLEDKWGGQRPCPYCGNTQWIVGPRIQLALVDEGPIASVPLFPASCRNCGNTVLLNADLDLEGDEG